MEITKDFIRVVLHLKTVNSEKDVEDIHKWIYAVNHDLALFYDDERYDNDANKFRDAVIELSTKLAKNYSADDVRTVAKYYELMKDWSIIDNIQKLSYDFNIFTCDAETIDGLRECVVDYVYDKVDKLVETNTTNLPNITLHTLHDPIDNDIIVGRACEYDSNLLILERDTHTIYIPFDCNINYFIKSRKEHSNIDVTCYSFEPMPSKIINSSHGKYIVCIFNIPKKEYNFSVESDLGDAIKKYYKATPRFNNLNFIIKYKADAR